MSSTPITTKALARLHALVQGNGIAAEQVTVTKTDEAIYTLHTELHLTPRFEIGVATPAEIKRLSPERLPSTDALRQLAAQRNFPQGWVAAALAELDTLPAQGWGAENKTIRLDEFTRLFAIAERCQQCNGNGRIDCRHCRRTGNMECEYCMRGNTATGKDPQDESRECPRCYGRREVTCRVCNGNGNVQCAACRGKGESVTTYALKFYADTRFAWTDSGVDLPITLRRSIDRAGIAKLANGHAAITRGDVIEGDVPRVPYTAALPFASVQFSINGEKHNAQILGHKAAILELHDFMDAPLAAAEQNGTLSTFRIYSEAQIIRARAGSLNDLLRLYPTGVSRDAADQILHLAGQQLRQQTRGPRWASVGAGVGGGTLLMALYFYGGLQGLLNPGGTSLLIDCAMLLMLCTGFIIGQRFYIKHILEKQLGQRNLRPPYFARHVFVGLSSIIALFALFTWLTAPTWLQMNRLLLEAYWMEWTRQ